MFRKKGVQPSFFKKDNKKDANYLALAAKLHI